MASHLTNEKRQRKEGCWINLPMGFLMVILGVAIAAAVGVLTFFASPARKVVCECQYPGPPKPPSWKDKWEMCQDLAVAKNICLSVPHCPGYEPPTTDIPSTTSPPRKDARLPFRVKPYHYDLEIRPNFYLPTPEEFHFNGTVTIHITCVTSTDVITLHVRSLALRDNARLVATDGSSAPSFTRFEEDPDRQFLMIYFSRPLVSGKNYTLGLTFSGPLKTDLVGLYMSSYKQDNQTHYLAATFFAPTNARKAFPCFDEPAAKATFSITLLHKPGFIPLSNMPVQYSLNRPGGWVAARFRTTLRMSTYIVAFAVSDFLSQERTTRNGTTIRVWARPEAQTQVSYALSITVALMETLEQYLGVPYPLPKQDMIALPDFSAGAMENWGLNTYRETTLLFDSVTSSAGDRQRIATVVSHEFAHQWFGNLVTMSWWGDLWIKEGFASYLEFIGADNVYPNWMLMDQMLNLDVLAVMQMDSLGSSRPIYLPVSQPDEINQVYDSISYNKAASVLRMLHGFLGDQLFKKALKNVLLTFKYGTASHGDVWRAVQQVVDREGRNINIKEVMDTWFLQMGFPVVTVTRAGRHLTVKQKHFLLDPTETPSRVSPFGYVWKIPFTYTTDRNITKDTILITEETSHIDTGESQITWVLANVGSKGYYRVNYDSQTWGALIRQLKTNHLAIGAANRAQIIDDSFNLGRAQMLDQTVGLSLIEYLVREREYVPWSSARTNIRYLSRMLSLTPTYGLYQEYVMRLVQPLYDYTGWETTPGDTHLHLLLRNKAVELACEAGYRTCVNSSVHHFNQWMNNPGTNPIPVDLRGAAYCTAVKQGGREEWEFAYRRHREENVAAEKTHLRNAMACTREPWLLLRYLRMTLDPDEIRSQDAVRVILRISENPAGQSLAWNFVVENWDHFLKQFGKGIFTLASLVRGVTKNFNTEQELNTLRDFLSRNSELGSAERAFSQALEKTQTNIRWMSRNLEDITQWLRNARASP